MKATITHDNEILEINMDDPFELGTLAALLSKQINTKIYGVPDQEQHIDWIKTAIESLYFVKEIIPEELY
ncbi:hypothetical protein ACT35X_000016 [Enterobacter hormaechei]